MNTITTPQQSGRLLSLDILRGITIAGMIMVNNPGSWSYVYTPLGHAHWHGLTPTDLVFPFFMFIMGVSTFMSLRKFRFEPSKAAIWKIVRRTILIFVIEGTGFRRILHTSCHTFRYPPHIRRTATIGAGLWLCSTDRYICKK